MLGTHKNYLFLFLFIFNTLSANEFSDDKDLRDAFNKSLYSMISFILTPTFLAVSSNFLSFIASLKNSSFSNDLASLLFNKPP